MNKNPLEQFKKLMNILRKLFRQSLKPKPISRYKLFFEELRKQRNKLAFVELVQSVANKFYGNAKQLIRLNDQIIILVENEIFTRKKQE